MVFNARAARRTRNDGYDGRLLRVNTRPIWTLNSACDGRISMAVTRRHPSQNGRYARFTGTGKVQNIDNVFCIYITNTMFRFLISNLSLAYNSNSSAMLAPARGSA